MKEPQTTQLQGHTMTAEELRTRIKIQNLIYWALNGDQKKAKKKVKK